MRTGNAWVLSISLACLLGCGGSGGGGETDAGRLDATTRCVVDGDCDDGAFCTGVERCDPGDARADARGCVPGAAPCAADRCDDTDDRCTSCTAAEADRDGDGHDAIACDGDDCDDDDANRFPDNAEICDADDHDEDCDPMTHGPRDMDADGFDDDACCNEDAGGMRYCGRDCDDDAMGVHPEVPEVCNGRDEDCDTRLDEGSMVMVYIDADDDGWGGTAMMLGCAGAPLTSAMTGDCDDADATRHPTATELCDGEDQDCDTTTDESAAASCAAGPGGMPICLGGSCGLTCDAGRLDCTAEPGCETDGDTSSEHCGDCATTCSGTVPNGRRECQHGGCTVVCDSGYTHCGADTCVDISTSTEHCMACGTVCSYANASAVCGASGCMMGACNAGYADCDGSETTGCELMGSCP